MLIVQWITYLFSRPYCKNLDVGDVVAVEAEWSAAGDVGNSPDESVLDDLSQWLWRWWRLPSMQVWQVQKFWVSSLHSAVVRLLVLASDIDWLATVPNWSLGQTSAEEADWTWVHCLLNPSVQKAYKCTYMLLACDTCNSLHTLGYITYVKISAIGRQITEILSVKISPHSGPTTL